MTTQKSVSYENERWFQKFMSSYNGKFPEIKLRQKDSFSSCFIVNELILEKLLQRNREAWFAFLLYDLDYWPLRNPQCPRITNRRVWLRSLDWVRNLPIHNPDSGRRTYVRKKHFSEGNDEEIEFESGRIYIPQNSEMISYLGIT